MKRAVRKAYHGAWQIHSHVVCPVKHRKALLDDEVLRIIRERTASTEDRYEIEKVDMDGDHIHLLCGAHPKLFPGRIVQMFKSITAREIFRKKPSAKKQRTQSPCTIPPSVVKTIMRSGIRNHHPHLFSPGTPAYGRKNRQTGGAQVFHQAALA